MDAAERALFTDTIRQIAVEHGGDSLDAALDEVGWPEALEVDQTTAVAVLFEAQGEANATSSALDQILSRALGIADPTTVAVVLPPLRSVEAPGTAAVDGTHVAVRGLGTSALARADRAVVVAVRNGTHESIVVPTSALELERVRGIDAALGLLEVAGRLEPSARSDVAAADWEAARALGQLALGHELVGAGRAMLELARAHALERIQFGLPIASFQAVRHRLAESLVALEAAAALLAAAWDEPDPVTAAMAKALAGRSARTVARHAQQVLAGIGFTAEHAFHRFFRRTVVLDQVLGAGSLLTRQLGEDTLATGLLPAALPL